MNGKVNQVKSINFISIVFKQTIVWAVATILLSGANHSPALSFELAAEIGHDVDAWKVVSATAFYVAIFSGSIFLFCISIALRRNIWAVYMCLITLGMIYVGLHEQNLSGIFWSGIVLSPRNLVLFGFFLSSCVFVVAAVAIDPNHHFIRFRPFLYAAAIGVWGIWLVSRYAPVETAILMFNIVGALSGVAHLIPLSTFTRLQGGPDNMMKTLVGTVLFCVVLAAVLVSVDGFAFLDQQIIINRFAIGLCLFAFSYLFINQIVAVRSDRERAIQENLDQAIEQVRINKELLEAEKRHSAAREVARLQNLRLATASHDIRQPITSLRTTMAVLAEKQPAKIRDQLKMAFDYLDQLAASYMEEAKTVSSNQESIEQLANLDESSANPIHDDVDASATIAAVEPVSVSLITGSLQRMFAAEAKERNLKYEVSMIEETVKVEPLALMRILSNLVSNGLKHTQEGFVSLNAEKMGGKVRFTIANSAYFKIDQDEAFGEWKKTESSTGSGLGLSVAQKQAENAGFDLEMSSNRKSGTKFVLSVPLMETVK